MLHFAVKGGAFTIPSGDAASKDALDGVAVKPFEDLRAYAKYFQPPEGEDMIFWVNTICCSRQPSVSVRRE
jgi:hypothetical protein